MEPRERPGTGAGTGTLYHPAAPPTVAPYALPVTKPLSSEYGTYRTVKARFWLWFSGESS